MRPRETTLSRVFLNRRNKTFRKILVKVLKSLQQENVTASEHGKEKSNLDAKQGGKKKKKKRMKNKLAVEKFLKKVDCFRSTNDETC